MKKDNITFVISKFADLLNVEINTRVVYEELLTHPDYPSLLAVSDVLQALQVNNAAYRVAPDQLSLVPFPFIAHTNGDGLGSFLIVHQVDKEKVTISNEKWNKRTLLSDDFKKMYDGVVLTAEPSVNKISPGIFTNLNSFKTVAIVAGLLVLLGAFLGLHTAYFSNLSWQSGTLTLFKSAGLFTSVLLLIQSIDSNNPLIQKLCQGSGKTNCNAILSSNAAQVFPGLTWSEVGFFYFAGTWLLLIFGNGSVALSQVLLALNVVSLPYTFYSIYYQSSVAKQWCLLCCTIQTLLWLEFIPLIASFHRPVVIPTYTEWIDSFCALLSPFLLWKLLKPLLLQAQQVHPLKLQLQKFKYNPALFKNLLTDQPKYAQPAEDWSIVLGNVEAGNIITLITNPYCSPCGKAHNQLHDLLEQNQNLQARIVFTASNHESDIRTPVSRHLMALSSLANKEIVKRALFDWYRQKQKNYEAWAKKYPVELNELEYNKINKQKAWCRMAEVTATPTILLNGYRLPDMYQLPNLKYMLD